MRVLVFGSTGLLGQAVAIEARLRGYATVGAARRDAEKTVDLARHRDVAGLISEVSPDIVINAAAMTDLDECEKDSRLAQAVNADAVAAMAAACHDVGGRLVQISTDHFFTGEGASLHGETASVQLVNEYARSKYAGETASLAFPHALVVRTNFTGTRGWPQPTFFEWAANSLRQRTPMTLFDDYFTSTIDAAALARALFDLIQKKATGLLNVASRQVASKRQFVEALAKAMDINLDWATNGSVKSLPLARAESLGLDVSRAQKILGYMLPDLATVAASLSEGDRGRR